VVYIWLVRGFAKSVGVWRVRAWAPLIAPLALVLALSGCGGDTAPTVSTPSTSPPAEATGTTSAKAANPPGQGGRERSQAKKKQPARPPAQVVARARSRTASRVCRHAMSRRDCATRLRGMSVTSHSHAVESPRDCVKARSRAQCKELIAAQAAAAKEVGESVDVEKCIEEPTPRCEAALRKVAEEQSRAQQSEK
jgi:hypothetical protein